MPIELLDFLFRCKSQFTGERKQEGVKEREEGVKKDAKKCRRGHGRGILHLAMYMWPTICAVAYFYPWRWTKIHFSGSIFALFFLLQHGPWEQDLESSDGQRGRKEREGTGSWAELWKQYAHGVMSIQCHTMGCGKKRKTKKDPDRGNGKVASKGDERRCIFWILGSWLLTVESDTDRMRVMLMLMLFLDVDADGKSGYNGSNISPCMAPDRLLQRLIL